MELGIVSAASLPYRLVLHGKFACHCCLIVMQRLEGFAGCREHGSVSAEVPVAARPSEAMMVHKWSLWTSTRLPTTCPYVHMPRNPLGRHCVGQLQIIVQLCNTLQPVNIFAPVPVTPGPGSAWLWSLHCNECPNLAHLHLWHLLGTAFLGYTINNL